MWSSFLSRGKKCVWVWDPDLAVLVFKRWRPFLCVSAWLHPQYVCVCMSGYSFGCGGIVGNRSSWPGFEPWAELLCWQCVHFRNGGFTGKWISLSSEANHYFPAVLFLIVTKKKEDILELCFLLAKVSMLMIKRRWRTMESDFQQWKIILKIFLIKSELVLLKLWICHFRNWILNIQMMCHSSATINMLKFCQLQCYHAHAKLL